MSVKVLLPSKMPISHCLHENGPCIWSEAQGNGRAPSRRALLKVDILSDQSAVLAHAQAQIMHTGVCKESMTNFAEVSDQISGLSISQRRAFDGSANAPTPRSLRYSSLLLENLLWRIMLVQCSLDPENIHELPINDYCLANRHFHCVTEDLC